MGKKRDRSSTGSSKSIRDGNADQDVEMKRRKRGRSSNNSITAFRTKTVEVVVSLLPDGLSNVRESIEQHLSRFLLRYTDGFKGILLAFNNVQFNRKGQIVNELPYVHYTVRIRDALVFSPQRGGALEGTVTETSFHSHVSLVVHQFFNASIAAEHLRSAGFEFSADMEEWVNDTTGQAIVKNSKLAFVIDKIHEAGGIISIEGTNPSLKL